MRRVFCAFRYVGDNSVPEKGIGTDKLACGVCVGRNHGHYGLRHCRVQASVAYFILNVPCRSCPRMRKIIDLIACRSTTASTSTGAIVRVTLKLLSLGAEDRMRIDVLSLCGAEQYYVAGAEFSLAEFSLNETWNGSWRDSWHNSRNESWNGSCSAPRLFAGGQSHANCGASIAAAIVAAITPLLSQCSGLDRNICGSARSKSGLVEFPALRRGSPDAARQPAPVLVPPAAEAISERSRSLMRQHIEKLMEPLLDRAMVASLARLANRRLVGREPPVTAADGGRGSPQPEDRDDAPTAAEAGADRRPLSAVRARRPRGCCAIDAGHTCAKRLCRGFFRRRERGVQRWSRGAPPLGTSGRSSSCESVDPR